MKTWMFVTAVFWLFYGMCVCPQSAEQTPSSNECIPDTTVDTDVCVRTWYFPSCVRPPPRPALALSSYDLIIRWIESTSRLQATGHKLPTYGLLLCAASGAALRIREPENQAFPDEGPDSRFTIHDLSTGDTYQESWTIQREVPGDL